MALALAGARWAALPMTSARAVRPRTLLALAALALAGPGLSAEVANASTAQGTERGVVYMAGPSEANDVSIVLSGAQITITDPGATITAQGSCNGGGTQVTCNLAATGPVSVRAELGTANDRLAYSANRDAPAIFLGGVGDDTLRGSDHVPSDPNSNSTETLGGGAGADVLDGGAGRDILHEADFDRQPEGPDGSDTMRGGADDDVLNIGPGVESDAIDGGPGYDSLDYNRRAAVSVDLTTPGGDGAAGENDDVGGIERLVGSPGADVLVTGASDEFVDGGPGDDQIDTGPGDDSLLGSAGRDTLRAGAGADQVVADETASPIALGESAQSDRLFCGAGDDRAQADSTDDVAADCEHVNEGGGGPGRPPELGLTTPRSAKLANVIRSGLPVSFSCSLACTATSQLTLDRRTAGRVGLAARRTVVIGRGAKRLRRAGDARLRVRLTSPARRRLKNSRTIKARLRTTFKNRRGDVIRVTTRKITLKR